MYGLTILLEKANLPEKEKRDIFREFFWDITDEQYAHTKSYLESMQNHITWKQRLKNWTLECRNILKIGYQGIMKTLTSAQT
jgi:hypothetical protein